MGKSDKRVTLTFDVQANLRDLQGQVGEMQKILGGLKMPDTLTQSTTKSINDLMDRIKKVQDYTAGNEINLVDEKKTQKELDGIRKDFLSLIDKLEAGSSKIKIGDNKATEALRKGIEEYRNSVKKTTEEYDKQGEKVKSLGKELDKIRSSKGNSVEKQLVNNIGKRITELKSQANNYKRQKENYKNEMLDKKHTESQIEVYWGNKNEGKEQQRILKELKEEQKKYDDALVAHNKTLQDTAKRSKDLQKEYDEESKKLDKLKEGLDGVSGRELDRLKQSLKDSDLSFDFDIDAINNIEDLEKKLDSLDAQSLEKVKEVLSKITDPANQGAKTINNLKKKIGEAREKSDEFNNSLESFKNKAAYFFGLENSINLFKRAVRSAYETVKDLDAVMTETAVVTEFDVGDMWDQLPEYTARANELGVSIHDAYEAATIYYQQGLKTNEVMAVSNETLKMARIAGLDAAEATDRMTNALRGFNMEINENNAQRVNDVYSELAAITASDTDEISVAMTKVASLAHNANMEFETTSAFLAQMIETTRESAETAGTALKTVVARFSEVKELYNQGDLMGTDEEGQEIDVNKVSVALRSAGINLNEYLSGAKGLDDIFIELASKWDSLDIVQQRYIATMAAGSRQQSRFIAMMSDYDRTMQLVSAANNSAGSSQKQYEKTLESLQTKLTKLKNAWDTFLMGIADSDVIKWFIDRATDLVTLINKIFEGLDGIPGSLTRIGAVLGGLHLGKSVIKNIITDINPNSKVFQTSGKDIALGLLKGVKNTFNDTKDFFAKNIFTKDAFTKDFWSKQLGKVDTTKFKKAITDCQAEVNSLQEKTSSLYDTMQTSLENGDIDAFNQSYDDYIQAENLLGEATEKNNTILSAQDAIINSGLPKKQQDILMEKAMADAKTLDTLATEGVTDELKNYASQAEKAAKSTALMKIGLLALGIAIPFAIKGFKKMWGAMHYNDPDKALERAEEATQEAKEAAEEATEAYNGLQEAINSIDEKTSSLEELIVGTKEWRDAVKQVNSEVLNLIETYDGLEVENKNGILVVTNKEEVEQEYENRENVAQIASLAAQKNQKEKEIDFNKEEIRKAITDSLDVEGAYLLASKRGDFDGTYTSFYQEYEAKFHDSDVLNQAIEKITNLEILTEDDLQNFFKENGFEIESDEDLIKILQEVNRSINNSSEEMGTLKTAMVAESVRQSGLTGEDAGIASNYLDRIAEAIETEEYNKSIDENEIISDDQLAIARGYDSYADYQEKTDKNFDNIDQSARRIEIAWIRTEERLESEATKFINGIKDANIPDYVRNKYSRNDNLGFTAEDLEGLEIEIDWTKWKDASEEERQEIINDISNKFREDWEANKELRELFNNDIDRFIDEMTATRLLTDFNRNRMYDNYKQIGIKDGNTGVASVSIGAQNDLLKNLESIYQISGPQAAQKIMDEIVQAMSGMAPDVQEKFLNALDATDWTNIESIDQLKEMLSLEGIDVSDEDLNLLTNDIKDFGNAVSHVDLKNLTEQLEKIAPIVAKINSGEQGFTGLDEEIVQAAIKGGIGEDQFYKDPSTGLYTYIGDDLQTLSKALQDGVKVDTSSYERDVNNGQVFKAVQEKRNLNTDAAGIEDYRNFFEDYFNKGGTAISQKTFSDYYRANNIEELKNLYEIAEKDYSALDDNTAKLDQANEINKELENAVDTGKSAVQLYQEGNKSAVQARANGILPEDFQDAKISEKAYLSDTFEKATKLGFDTEELTNYIKQLQLIYPELTLIGAAQLALSNTRTNKGMENLVDTYEDWSVLIDEDGNLLKDLDSNSSEILTSMKKSANDLLDTQEDLSDEFWENTENVKLFKKAVEEGGQSLIDLRIAAAKDYAIQFNIPDEATDEINALYDYIAQSTPTMEVGTKMDIEPIIKAYEAILESGVMTAKELQKYFGALGVEFDVYYKKVPLIKKINGVDKQVGFQDSDVIDCIIPHYKGGVKPSTTYSSKNKGGGGGSSSSDKTDTWENPYDELYNLQEKINEALRTREALERKYQKLLKKTSSTVGEVSKAYYDQIRQLRTEADLQYEMQAGRARQLNNVGNEYYTDDEGNRSTFSSLGVTKYGSYNQQTGLLQIDWSGLEALENDPSKVNEGKAAEAYISRLEELQDQFEEVRDELWDIEDQIEELREEAIENYLTFEDRVMEALVNSYQTEIDNYSALNDAITSATDDIIRGIQDEINLSRQIRDNTQKEEDIADKEARLAYLRRDTSGANAMEIKKLEEELNNDRQSYSDTMIDQQIAAMQNDATLASEQRQHQIEIMQNQLEVAKQNGTLWGEVWNLLNTATAGDGTFSQNSELVTLLEEAEAFQSLSRVGQAKWWEEAATAFKEARVGLDEAEDKYKVDANNDGKITSSGTSSTVSSISNMTSSGAGSGSTTGTGAQATSGAQAGNGYFSKVGSYEKPKAQMPAAEVKYLQQALNAAGFTDANGKPVNVDGVYGPKTMAAVKKLQAAVGTTVDGYFGTKTRAATMASKYKAYETGGLNDTTGPAWLDGTKTKPELVLNWKDTQNFIALKDILANLMGGQGGAISGGGDNYYDINISAELGSDYDVDKLAERIKKRIYDDSSYRNVNAINFTR